MTTTTDQMTPIVYPCHPVRRRLGGITAISIAALVALTCGPKAERHR